MRYDESLFSRKNLHPLNRQENERTHTDFQTKVVPYLNFKEVSPSAYMCSSV
jgi:hypothetical protein